MGVGAVAVHLIRAIDRCGGFTARRGEEVYGRAAPRFTGPLHRRIVRDAQALLGSRSGALIIDLGSGPGALTGGIGERLPAATVIGVEPNPRMLELATAAPAPRNVSFRAGAAESIPVDDRSAALVVSAFSAHHWTDLAAAVAELRRVLEPGGIARIYDVRFATYTAEELRAVSDSLGLPPSALRRSVPPDQGRFAPYALIELQV